MNNETENNKKKKKKLWEHARFWGAVAILAGALMQLRQETAEAGKVLIQVGAGALIVGDAKAEKGSIIKGIVNRINKLKMEGTIDKRIITIRNNSNNDANNWDFSGSLSQAVDQQDE